MLSSWIELGGEIEEIVEKLCEVGRLEDIKTWGGIVFCVVIKTGQSHCRSSVELATMIQEKEMIARP